jgi:predicted nucleotidyltransferase
LNSNINKFPTPYPDVNEVLLTLLDNVRAILGDYFTGMYLYGSLASGDFDPRRSDIDFLVVTS